MGLAGNVMDVCLLAGDLVSGVARGAEAMLTALSVATGIAIAISLFI